MAYQVVAIEHRVHRADRWQVRASELLPELFTDLRCPPTRILSLQADDRRLNRRRQSIRLPVCTMAPITEGLHPEVLIPVEGLVAGLPRNPELGAQGRHLLALEQAGDKPESLVHDVTLLPRHVPSWRGQSVTHPLGIRCYVSLRKDNENLHNSQRVRELAESSAVLAPWRPSARLARHRRREGRPTDDADADRGQRTGSSGRDQRSVSAPHRISERSRLPLLVPIREANQLHVAFPDAVCRMLAAVGVCAADVELERSQTTEIMYGRTQSRSLLAWTTLVGFEHHVRVQPRRPPRGQPARPGRNQSYRHNHGRQRCGIRRLDAEQH